MASLHGLLPVTLCLCLCAVASPTVQESFPPNHPTDATSTDATTFSSSPDVATLPVEDTSLQLSGNLCSLGTNFSSVRPERDPTAPGKLYVEYGATAPCTGVILRWDVCFIRRRSMDSDDGVDFVVLRIDQSTGEYLIVDVHELRFSKDTQCDYIANNDSRARLEEGDVLGFVNRGSVRVAVTSLVQGTYSTLRSTQIHGKGGPEQMQEGSILMINSSIPQDRFEPSTQQVTPLIRVILNSTSSRSVDESTPPSPTSDAPPCNLLNGQDKKVQDSVLFISVTSSAGFVILTLIAIVLGMACCLCQRHCYKLLCPRSKKKHVKHVVHMEPMFEQSMQYNDLYVPSNQDEVITRGEKHTTRIQSNPAYNTSPIRNTHAEGHLNHGGRHSQGCEELEFATTTFSKATAPKWPMAGLAQVDTTQQDLEHTYEVIKSMKLS